MRKILICFLLSACVGQSVFVSNDFVPNDFVRQDIKTQNYEIATWQKINSPKNNTLHIYIEGDGHAFDAYGRPSFDPTPQSTTLRQIAFNDDFDNVVYIARPCQFIMDKNCSVSDWTNGRFSQKIIDSVSSVIKQISMGRDIVLIGYSGGAMVSGLVIEQNKNLPIKQWVTIAGVLDHEKWTQYFGDTKLDASLNMKQLPKIKQTHFVGGRDDVVPYELAKQWANEKDIVLIETATHDNFKNLKIFD